MASMYGVAKFAGRALDLLERGVVALERLAGVEPPIAECHHSGKGGFFLCKNAGQKCHNCGRECVDHPNIDCEEFTP